MGAYTCEYGVVHKRCRCREEHTIKCDVPDEHNPVDEYRERLERAIAALSDLAGEEGSIFSNYDESRRLMAKREGVQLALSYYDEMSRDANGETRDD